MSFSFGRIAAGLGLGMTIPFMVNHDVYYAIATCFLSPHLNYWKEHYKKHQDKAISVESLDAYIKDVGKSFIFFWLIIGPTCYKTYYLKESILENAGMPDFANPNGRSMTEQEAKKASEEVD